jgi:hypothetical protein
MTKLLYNTITTQLLAYPRQDDEPLVGLDPAMVVLELVEQAAPAHNPATHQLEQTDTIDLDTHTVQREWIAKPLPAQTLIEANFIGFYEAISTDPGVNSMLGSVLAAVPALYGGLIVGLSRVSEGDTRLFLAAWSNVKALFPLQAELVDSLQAAATAYHLPPDFIAGLA